MSFTSIISLFALVLGCVGSDDPIPPNKDAPDLDFSKGKWVNEFQYDGVFTIKKRTNGTGQGIFMLYGADAKEFNPENSAYKIDNGFWFDEKKSYFIGPNPRYNPGIVSRVSINKLEFDYYKDNHFLYLGEFNANNKSLNYDPKTGLDWQVIDLSIPETEDYVLKNKLTHADENDFKIKKTVTDFPEPIKVENSYTMSEDQKELTLEIPENKYADLIYVTIDNQTYNSSSNLNPLKSSGYIKSFKGDTKSIAILKKEIQLYLFDAKTVNMTISAVKFYTLKEGKRIFLFKNIGESKATITLE